MAKLVGASVYNNANISIPNNSATAATFNTEDYDTDNIHSTVSNTGRLTCQTAGKYLIVANYSLAGNASGIREFFIKLNGGNYIAADSGKAPIAADAWRNSLSKIIELAVSNYVEFVVFQNSGGALNLEYSADFSPYFSMHRIG
jgi:hypothetical protein